MKKNNKTDMKKSAKQNYNCDNNNNNASKNSTEKHYSKNRKKSIFQL